MSTKRQVSRCAKKGDDKNDNGGQLMPTKKVVILAMLAVAIIAIIASGYMEDYEKIGPVEYNIISSVEDMIVVPEPLTKIRAEKDIIIVPTTLTEGTIVKNGLKVIIVQEGDSGTFKEVRIKDIGDKYGKEAISFIPVYSRISSAPIEIYWGTTLDSFRDGKVQKSSNNVFLEAGETKYIKGVSLNGDTQIFEVTRKTG